MDKSTDQFDSFVDALENGNLAQVVELIDRTPELLSLRNESGRSALHIVMFCSDENVQIQLVALLLSRGANVNAADERNWTVLHEAVFNSTANVVRFLLDHGAKINAIDKSGRTPLDQAREDRFADTEEVLLSQGATTGTALVEGRPE